MSFLLNRGLHLFTHIFDFLGSFQNSSMKPFYIHILCDTSFCWIIVIPCRRYLNSYFRWYVPQNSSFFFLNSTQQFYSERRNVSKSKDKHNWTIMPKNEMQTLQRYFVWLVSHDFQNFLVYQQTCGKKIH